MGEIVFWVSSNGRIDTKHFLIQQDLKSGTRLLTYSLFCSIESSRDSDMLAARWHLDLTEISLRN